jgi:non-specific serine/threonine protein kinase/serine/threonine-protein kinase
MSATDAEAKAIFLDALEHEAQGELARYLDAACGADGALRARVEALLTAHRNAGHFLGGTTDDGAEPSDERSESAFGPYRLLERIGEGGFGDVYLAEQRRPVRRLVALKVLKPGMDTRQIIARFEAERQALALMDHPNIAKVFDAGTTRQGDRETRRHGDKETGRQEVKERSSVSLSPCLLVSLSYPGRPYFGMELVKGVPITQYCDEHRLTPRQRLELLIPVCQAIQHAHQKGIIHRDIKPSNVLVAAYDGKPVPKVIDFGIAKALGQQLTERTLVTGFGAIVGTLEYMSPEQAEFNALDVDTRADIYSLGVLLYELLTGTTPLTRDRVRQTPMMEALRLIREEEPPKPSTRLSDSHDTLASISAQRQLEPARLTRELRGELDWIVMKCLEKDRGRRYETCSALARDLERYLNDEPVEACPPSAAYRLRKFVRKNRKWLTAAGAFALVLLAATGVSIGFAVKAMAAEKRATTALDGEAAERKQARAVLDFFEKRVLSALRPKGQEGGLGKDATIRAALDQAEPEIAAAFADQPLAEASIRNVLGVSYWYVGDWDAAMRQQERALELRRRVLGPDHHDTVGVMNDLGIIFHAQGKVAEAQKLFAEAVEVKRRLLGPEDASTLRSVNNLAATLAEQGEFAEASRLTEENWHIQQRVEGPESIFTLRSAYNLSIMWRHMGRFDDSRRLFEETLATLKRAFSPKHQDTLRVLAYLGELHLDRGDSAAAHPLFDEALAGQLKVLGPAHEETLMTRIDLADTLRVEGRLDAAHNQITEAIELNRRHLGNEHPQTLVAQAVLADTLRDQGRFTEARNLYEKTLSDQRRVLGPKTPEMQRLMIGFAWLLANADDPTVRDPARAVELAREVIKHSKGLADKWTTLGVASYRAGDSAQALHALTQAASLPPGRLRGVHGFFLAMAKWQAGEKDLAREDYRRAVTTLATESTGAVAARPFQTEAARLLGIAEP